MGWFVFQMGRGFIFKWGAPHAGGIDLDGGTGRGGSKKNVGWGEGTPPYYGKPCVFLVLNILISDPQLPWHSSPEGLRINFIALIYLPNLGLLVDLRLDSILQTRLLHISCKYSISYFHIFIKQPKSFIKWNQVFHDHFLTWFVYGSNVSWRYC